ncbi:TPA: phosphatidylserine decarboxylase, partial [archaeon]|nr:phosphatidylserine decarboxylase [Candidatus Naiadarchaeales archaeon SRR2090153.bin1042]
ALSSSFDSHFATYAFLFLIGFFSIFFRDPQRKIPLAKNIIVSPADGRVKSIKDYGAFKAVHIFIGPLDVHINRSPISGVIQNITPKKGKHKIAFRKAAELNAENYITIKSGKRKITVVQIVGFMARRIKCWVNVLERVKIGQPIGMILFGSGTKLILPSNAKILVQKKQRVKAGETIVAKF